MITSKMKVLNLPSLVVLTLLFCGADGAAGQEAGGNHTPTPAPEERMLMDLLDLAHQIGHRQGAGEIDAEQAKDAMRRNRGMAGEILTMAQSRSTSDAATLAQCHQDLRRMGALCAEAKRAGSEDREACAARIEGVHRQLAATMELNKGCRQKLQQTQITLERVKHSAEAGERDRNDEAEVRDGRGRTNVQVPARRGQSRVRDHRREVQVRDHRGKVDVWDAGVVAFWDPEVSVQKPGKRGNDELFSSDRMDTAQRNQPPAELPKRGEVRSWFEGYNQGLRVLVQRAWSREESDGFFADESRNCKGNLYCELDARRQAISLAVSGL